MTEQAPEGNAPQGVSTGTAPTGSNQQAPYAQYLEKIPEALRGSVEPVFKEWDGNVTQRFQTLQDQLKGYAPYQPLFDGYEAEALQGAVEFMEGLQDPKNMEQLFHGLAERLGYSIADDDGSNPDDPYGQQQQPFDISQDPNFRQIQEQLGSVAEYLQQNQTQQEEAAAIAEIDKEYQSLLKQHFGDAEVPEKVSNFILKAAVGNGGDLPGAFQDYFDIVGQQAQQQNMPGQNAPIVGGGAQSNMPAATDPKALTREQRVAGALSIVNGANAQR